MMGLGVCLIFGNKPLTRVDEFLLVGDDLLF